MRCRLLRHMKPVVPGMESASTGSQVARTVPCCPKCQMNPRTLVAIPCGRDSLVDARRDSNTLVRRLSLALESAHSPMYVGPAPLGFCPLEQFDFVAVGVVDEGHLPALGEDLAPTVRPNLDSLFFQLGAECNEVGDADGEVHQVLRNVEVIVVGVGKLQRMQVAG